MELVDVNFSDFAAASDCTSLEPGIDGCLTARLWCLELHLVILGHSGHVLLKVTAKRLM